jgi:hypothetical protein
LLKKDYYHNYPTYIKKLNHANIFGILSKAVLGPLFLCK